MDAQILAYEQAAGIVFDGFDARMLPPQHKSLRSLAMDAAFPLVTTPNSGIPAMLSTYIDPKLIETLVAPMKAAEAVGNELKYGDWTRRTAMFPVIEYTGEVTSYGDFNANGSTGVNANFPQRQSYSYQTITQWGEKELEDASLAKIDVAARKNIASALALNKFQNKTYLFGVAGLQNYGMLNDPNLSAPITPITKAAGGTAWILPNGNINATAVEAQRDVSKLFYQLVTQTNGLVETDSPMTLIMSPQTSIGLTITDQFNVNLRDILNKTYPNLKIVTVPEYATASGQLMQLVLEEYEGQRTWDCAFTEKMRAHAVITEISWWKQKKSAGTWGTILYRPMFVAQMLGL